MTIRTDSRIRSTPSPARNASSSSETADWDKAIGGVPFGECLAVHTEDLAGGPHMPGAAPITLKPHHSTGRLPPRGVRGPLGAVLPYSRAACDVPCRLTR